MSVHYKLKSAKDYDNVKFDGVYISASDLKSIIVQQKKLGNSDLQLKNEETGQCYTDDQMIPKNTNIVVIRLPFANSNKKTRLMASQPYPARFSGNANSSGQTGAISGSSSSTNNNSNNSNHHHNHHHHNNNNNHHNNNNRHNSSGSAYPSSSLASATLGSGLNKESDSNSGNREAMELVSTKTMSEEEKLKSIQSQSTKDFDVSRYARTGRGGGPGGRGGVYNRPHYTPGPNYTCRKCGIPGHLIYDCKSNAMHKVKRSSGIPRDFLMKVDSKEKGALMTPTGEYAVPFIDREAYNNPKIEKAPFFEDGTPSDELTATTASKY